jgi:hypothetical protein
MGTLDEDIATLSGAAEVPTVIVPEVPSCADGAPKASVVAPKVAVETLRNAARARVVFIYRFLLLSITWELGQIPY